VISLRGLFSARGALLNRAGHRGEDVVGVCTDQSNRTDNNDQNHSQHHGILRDVLTAIISQDFGKNRHFISPFESDFAPALAPRQSAVEIGATSAIRPDFNMTMFDFGAIRNVTQRG